MGRKNKTKKAGGHERNAVHARVRSGASRKRVVGAFFLSGAAGLMHQVVWSRLLVSLIGATEVDPIF